MSRLSRPVVIGVLCAIPIAFLAGWFANFLFDPAIRDPHNVINAMLGLGPLRGVAFAIGALVAAAVIAPRLAREDLGSFGGLFAYIVLAHVIAMAGAALEVAVRDPGVVNLGWVISVPLVAVFTLGPCLIVWLPSSAVWVTAVRRLTIEDLPVPTDLEPAQSEDMRNESARTHVVVDATNFADQGSRLYRNRG